MFPMHFNAVFSNFSVISLPKGCHFSSWVDETGLTMENNRPAASKYTLDYTGTVLRTKFEFIASNKIRGFIFI
jgi:hypothetical protein